MRKQRRKKQKRVIIFFSLVLIILIVLLVILTNKESKSQQVEGPTFDEFIEEYEKKVIYPRNMYELQAFEGDTSTGTLYESLKVFVDYISYLSENVNDSDSSDFFQQESEEIEDKLGITEEEDFVKFIEYIKDKNLNIEDYKYAEVVIGSSYVEDRYFTFLVNLYYGDTSEFVQFKVAFAEKKNNKIPVIYSGVE